MKALFFLLPLIFLFPGTPSPAQSTKNKVIPPPAKDINQVTDNTLDSLNKVRTARPVSGSSRKGNNPVLFLVGNSTMRTGTLGNGNNGQWGWGFYAPEYFDQDKITVENHALGGTSSRTFYNRFWPDVLKGIQPGDWVIIELGHNDNGPYDSGRARASIKGTGKDSLKVVIRETGKPETVYSYGEYMRRFIRDVRAKGAHPVLFSLTPRNAWDKSGKHIIRVNKTYGLWAKQIAKEQKVPFINLNDITARKFEKYGPAKVNDMFYSDKIHTSAFGARENAASAAEGIRQCPGLELKHYLKPAEEDTLTGASRKRKRPVLFLIGDSTVKNEDKDEDSMWGWGSVIGEWFDPRKISVENWAKAGRSSRTFLDEGRWDKIYRALKPGDFVLIQFGHNDGGDINTGKARGTLKGAGKESKVMKMEATNRYQVIYPFGWYIRKYIMDTQEKGAIPIVLSHTPRNQWNTDGTVKRNAETYGKWSKQAADSTGACFIDLNEISAAKLEKIGKENAKQYFRKDHTHTSLQGARLNAESIVEGLINSSCPLRKKLK